MGSQVNQGCGGELLLNSGFSGVVMSQGGGVEGGGNGDRFFFRTW